MDREQMRKELLSRVRNEEVIQHSLIVESIMRVCARFFKDDEEKWGITGLLHDIDHDKCIDPAKRSGQIAEEILEGMGMDDFIIYAIKAHNNENQLERKRKLDKALYSANALAILLQGCYDEIKAKAWTDLSVSFVLEKLEDMQFIVEANRDHIRVCTKMGIAVKDFVDLSLQGIQSDTLSKRF